MSIKKRKWLVIFHMWVEWMVVKSCSSLSMGIWVDWLPISWPQRNPLKSISNPPHLTNGCSVKHWQLSVKKMYILQLSAKWSMEVSIKAEISQPCLCMEGLLTNVLLQGGKSLLSRSVRWYLIASCFQQSSVSLLWCYWRHSIATYIS